MDAEGEPVAVVERLDDAGGGEDGVGDGQVAEALVGVRKEERLYEAGVVGQRDELHQLAGGGGVDAVGDHQTADRHATARVSMV